MRLEHHDGEVVGTSTILLNVESMIIAEVNPYLCCTTIKYREDSVKTIDCAEQVETIMHLINQKNY